ncbi:ABC transporter substrate-binding protein [Mesorhizobium sp. YR577]|uniref:ABC transporter substrate-binding protein n=1 Tax=Mesorhizobium sp. YR577 TaxID=1884373 RepID=UPI00158737AA|nr:ABC transporter substrate-binding protein [Mesorhizobium sp. YR577]
MLTDIEARELTIAAPARRILLATPSWYPALAILDNEVAKRVIGIGRNPGDTLPEAERDLSGKPRVGSTWSQTFSIEKALELKPDIVIGGRPSRVQSQALESAFAKAGIPVVYVDFDSHPVRDTDRSFEILGRVLGAEDKAAEFVDFYRRHVRTITDRLTTPGLARPTLLMMSRGPSVPCCLASPDNGVTAYFGGLGVENLAGVTNGAPVQFSLESIIERDPDIFVAIDLFSDSRSMFGQPRSLAQGTASLETLKQEPGLRELAAMRNGRVHVLDSYLMRSPLNFVTFEALAKWIHPELFADLDPQATLDEINRRFLKTPLKGPFWTSLDPATDRSFGERR